MSCQNCDHTMHGFGGGAFWCPRCGSIKYQGNEATPKSREVLEQVDTALAVAGSGGVPVVENIRAIITSSGQKIDVLGEVARAASEDCAKSGKWHQAEDGSIVMGWTDG